MHACGFSEMTLWACLAFVDRSRACLDDSCVKQLPV